MSPLPRKRAKSTARTPRESLPYKKPREKRTPAPAAPSRRFDPGLPPTRPGLPTPRKPVPPGRRPAPPKPRGPGVGMESYEDAVTNAPKGFRPKLLPNGRWTFERTPNVQTPGQAQTSAARAKIIAAAKAKEKKRVASYKPKYRMGSRGGVRDDI